ncbi:MAG: hypothetical protein JNM96_07405, partial [Bacteroidia bacterium]|nr:hypothetical protein [Bacteroidia bacterium]
VAPEGMCVLDLTKYGKPFAIFVPDTVQAKLSVTEQSYGALEITVGPNFGVAISELAEDLNQKKAEIKDDEINKLTSYITDEPTAIFWESAITEPEFHFIVNQKIGEADYNIQDIRSTEGKPLDKAAVQKMFDSAKNIKEVKKEEPAS